MDTALRRRLDAIVALLAGILVFTVVIAHELDRALTVTALAVFVVAGAFVAMEYGDRIATGSD